MRSSDDAITALKNYLKSEIPELTVLDEWPDPKHQFVFPTIVIMAAGARGYTHEFPTIFKKTQNLDNPDNFDVVYTVGQFDYTLQVDIWTDYKSKRGEMFDLVQAAFNKEFINGDQPCGLSLTMNDYYDLIARFDQVGYTYLDSEESSQRSEWRVKIDVLVTHSRLQVKTESKMLDLQIQSQISEQVSIENDDANLIETTVI